MGINLLKLLSAIILAYAFYAALVFIAQRKMMYPGKTIQAPATPSPMVGRTTLWLKTRFGRVETWYVPGQGKGRRPLVIFFHGNGEIIDFLPGQIEGFNAMGMGVLAIEYPGYGRSQGSPSEESITETALAAYDMITKRNDVDPSRVMAFGRSLGGGVACALSRQRPLAALILQSPFTSTRPFARRYLLPSFLVRDVFDNAAALASFPGPVLIFHGRRDDIIPFEHGKELAGIARKARFVELPCAHNDCPPDWGGFLQTVEKFLRDEKIL
ncbi:MAG: alpha/beta hydrolase [Geobacter sp.]|nr:alpha/beta hydrolase [Geobacter sp.]